MQKIFTSLPAGENKFIDLERPLQIAIWILVAFEGVVTAVTLYRLFTQGEGLLLAVISVISIVILLITHSMLTRIGKMHKSLEARAREESQLRDESELKLRTLMESVPFDMWLTDKEQHYILQSRESYRLAGDIIGKKPEELGRPEEIISQWKSEYQRAELGENIYREGTWPINGELRDFMTMVAPVKNHERLLGFIGLNLDITERKRSEKQARHSAEQLTMLNDIGRAITTLGDVDSVLNIIREQVQRILPLDAFMVILYQPDTNMVTFPLVYDNGVNWPEPDRQLTPDMKSFEILRTGRPMLVNLTPEELEAAAQNTTRSLTGDRASLYRSFIYAPLVRQDKVIGVVSAISYDFNAYTDEHLELLEGVAIQATIAIENARLFQAQQKELAERKQAENEIRKLNAELEARVESRTLELKNANTDLNHEKARLESYTHQREILAAMIDLLQASLTTTDASGIVSSYIKLLFPDKDGALYLINSQGMLEPISIWGSQKSLDVMYTTNECWGMRRGKPYEFGKGLPNPACSHAGSNVPHHALCIPLTGQGESLGSLHILTAQGSNNEAMNEEEKSFVVTMADSIALAISNLRLREKLHIQSIRDALTGLFNRRYLDETLPREINRAERGETSLSVLMFDIDHFKKFNDTYGHDAGDIVLKSVADVIQSSIRESDIACRYGGEEFMIILPDTPIETAERRAELLRNQTSMLELNYNGRQLGTITISIGVAAYPQHGETRDTLIKTADEAAYQAKQNGRNCVVVSR